jgi:hypothetical protein
MKIIILSLVLIITTFILTVYFIELPEAVPCEKEPYQQNQMVDGCVMQKSGGIWLKTCG